MRIRWTSIPNVVSSNPAGPSAATALEERPKKEANTQRAPANNKGRKKTKTERAIEWLAGKNQ